VRTKPVLGRKLWFGPRGWGGWGWEPVSSEGWATIAVFVAATIVIAAVMNGSEEFGTIFLLLVGALVVVCWLKGTSPGGPKARRMMQIQREREEDDRRERA
jgi:hypothetical protein